MRNGYTIKLMNRADSPRDFVLDFGGLTPREVKVIGLENPGVPARIDVAADKVRTLRVLVTVAPKSLNGTSAPVFFTVTEPVHYEQRRVAAGVFVVGRQAMTGHLTGRGVLIWLFGFFGVIFATNAYFIMVSTRTFRGEDEQKPYLQGVEYNQTLARHAEQAALGWQAAITAARLPGGHVRIEIRMCDRAGKPVAETGLAGELRHPADGVIVTGRCN